MENLTPQSRVLVDDGGHSDYSCRNILRVAEWAAHDSVLVLGAGQCKEIPLRELVSTFNHVTLNDQDARPLADAVISSELSLVEGSKVQLWRQDLTGTTHTYASEVVATLDKFHRDGPEACAQHISKLTLSTPVASVIGDRTYDFIVASCLLSQLHVRVCDHARELFRARFPDDELKLLTCPSWGLALYTLARRMEEHLIDDIYRLLRPGGRLYLSDTTHCSFLHPSPGNQWFTRGYYLLIRTARLQDYLDERFVTQYLGRWTWTVTSTAPSAQPDRIYLVQALDSKCLKTC
jgi:hypothetical protein